jgi:hypothetical protein
MRQDALLDGLEAMSYPDLQSSTDADMGRLEHRSGGALRRQVRIGTTAFEASPVFDTYWRFASVRQTAYEARGSGRLGPWTSDPILARHRFTNCFRAADRISQYLIRNVIYGGRQDAAEVVFRVLLFKFFNRIDTWTALQQEFGTPSLDDFDVVAWSEFLIHRSSSGPIYSAAYVMPQPPFGALRKATNHLLLLRQMIEDGLPDALVESQTMEDAFGLIRAYSGLGDFLAYQYLIDINYSEIINFDEMDFVVAGPGARDGIHKCFGARAAGHEAAIIRYMAETQDEQFARLGLPFHGLGGRRGLTLIDCQNLFCETDKYARVAHPQIGGLSGRTRIKQVYRPAGPLDRAWFPPKWGINDLV